MRRSFLVFTLVLLAGAVALGLWLSKKPKPPETTEITREPPPAEEPAQPTTPVPAMPQQPVPSPAPAVVTPKPEPSAETRQLVAALTQFKGPISPELAALWKSNLTQLVQQGPAAVPAIREFLEQNKDITY